MTSSPESALQTYLNRSPGYNLAGLLNNVSELETVLLAHDEQIEFSLKQYLAGKRTQAQLFAEIETFLRFDVEFATDGIGLSLYYVGTTLTELEAYEALAHFQTLSQVIADTFSIVPITPPNP